MIKSLIFSVFQCFYRSMNFLRPTVQPVAVRVKKNPRPNLGRISILLIGLLVVASGSLYAQVPNGVYPNTVDANGKKQGAWKKTDENGKTVYVGQFKDDKPYGVFTYFDTEGLKMTEMDFGDGKTNVQHAKMFYIDGKLQAEGKYVNQQKDSVWKFYSMDGLFLSEENWVNGKREGKSTVYFPGTKQAASITTWKNGVEDGPYVEYYADGAKKMEVNYVAGNMEGTATWYFEDGRINIIGAYQHAVKHGKWTYYNADGSVKGTETWHQGKLTSAEQIIKPEDMNKTIEDPQNPDHNREGGGGGN